MFKRLLCVYMLVTVINFYGSTDALQCHVCRNCPEVSADTLRTCPSRSDRNHPTSNTKGGRDTDGTTDNKTTENIITDSKVIGRIDTENKIGESVPTAIEVPGDEEKYQYMNFAGINAPQRVFLGTLKQARDNYEPACLLTTFQENGRTVYVRACTFVTENALDSCYSAAGVIPGPVQRCFVCTHSNGCNGASSATSNAAFTAISTLAILAIGLIGNCKIFFA